MKPSKDTTIMIKLTSPHLVATRPLAYQVVGRALEKLGGTEGHIARSEVIAEAKAELERMGGYRINNLDATVSSFCALPGVEAICEYPGGHTEPFQSMRTRPQRLAVPEDVSADQTP